MFSFFRRQKKVVSIPFATSDVKNTVQERAAFAKALLNNPVFKEAVQELTKEASYLWETCMVEEFEKREFLWRYIKALNQIKGRVERYVNDALYQEANEKRQAPPEQRE